MSTINFRRPKPTLDLPAKEPRDTPHISATDFQELKEISPGAALFTLHENSDSDATDTASEDENNPFNDLPEPRTHHASL